MDLVTQSLNGSQLLPSCAWVAGMGFGAGVKGKMQCSSAGSAGFELQNISLLGLVGCFNLL